MKIPGTPNAAKTVAIPTPYANTDTRGAFGESFGSVADKADRAVDAVQVEMKKADLEAERAAQKVRAQAKAISKANADAAYQRADTELTVGGSNRRSLIDQAFEGGANPSSADVKDQPGFFSTRGKEAYAKSGEVLTELDKRRQQIAKDNFADLQEREEWLAQSADLYAASERRVESHAAQQFEVARKDALEGLRASALDQIAAAESPADVATIAAGVEARIREMAPSEEGANADLEKFRADAVETVIGRMLAAGDVAHAEGQMNVAKAVLGARLPRVKHAIDAAKKAQDVQTFDVEAQKGVDRIVEEGTGPEGRPDFRVMDAKLGNVPAGKLRDEMEQRMTHAKVKAARRWDERVSGFYDGALSKYLQAGTLGAVDPKVKSWLLENAPEEWAKLKARERSDADYWRRLREGKEGKTPESVEALVAAKADIDERADFYRTLTPEQFFRQPALTGLTPDGLKEVGGYWVGMKKRDPIPDGEFNRDVTARIDASPALQKDKAAARAYRARMNQQRLEHLKEHQNREPTYDERDKMDEEATRSVVTHRGFFYDTKKPAYLVPGTGPETGPVLGPPASAKPEKKLAPGRYADKSGKVWVVDAAGNKRAE